MNLEALNRLTNGNYINNPVELAHSLKIADSNELIDFLKLVHTYNEDIIKHQEKRIKTAKENEAKSKVPLVVSSIVEDIQPSFEYTPVYTEEEISQKAHEIISRIKVASLEDIPSLLPSKDSTNFHSIMNELMVSYCKDIVFFSNFLLEFGKDSNQQEIENLEKELERARGVLQVLKESRKEVDEEEILLTENEPPILVHLETPTHKSYLYQDLEEVPIETHKHFLRIYEPFLKGEPVFIKYMSNYKGILCIKNKIHQSRIYMTHISSNIYTVIGALNKKTNWSKSEKNFITNRYATWNVKRDKILSEISNPSFIASQQEKTEEVLKLLKRGF